MHEAWSCAGTSYSNRLESLHEYSVHLWSFTTLFEIMRPWNFESQTWNLQHFNTYC